MHKASVVKSIPEGSRLFSYPMLCFAVPSRHKNAQTSEMVNEEGEPDNYAYALRS